MLALCRRGCSLNTRFFSSIPQAIEIVVPPNLKLQDLSILDEPKPSILPPLRSLFPEKSINTSIPVHSFLGPESMPLSFAYLDPKVFGVAIRQDIIHQIVRYQRAKIRQPQCTKRIADIRGSTRKLYQQKGTGRARVGQNRASHRRGGMKAHGPVLRDFSFSLNRKMRALGLMIALAAKQREGNLHVFDKLTCQVGFDDLVLPLLILMAGATHQTAHHTSGKTRTACETYALYR
jgi:ribosomal protein L4